MIEAACTSGTSVDNYFTRQYIPEDKYELHTRRRENLTSHIQESLSPGLELRKNFRVLTFYVQKSLPDLEA
jgi:hypothetical protein